MSRVLWPIAIALALLCSGPATRSVATAQPPAPTSPVPPAMPEAPGATPALDQPEALRPFFRALERTQAEGTITRVTHLGDSSVGLDDLPHRIRRVYQQRHGDAGPGYVLLQAPTGNYGSRLLWLGSDPPWEMCFIIRRCMRDGHYGLGGVTVMSSGGAQSTITMHRDRQISRAELWYAAHPTGGRIAFRLGRGDSAFARLETRAPALEDRWHEVSREPGPHGVRVSADGGGESRAYGVVLENAGPGVVWDSISMIGAFTPRLLAADEAHFAAQLAHRDPALVVLNYGGNDLRRLVGRRVDEARFTDETAEVLGRVRRAVPGAACLLMAINDHEQSGAAGVERRHVEAIVRAQRAAAARTGCAFYDTVAAMGGPGSYATWRRLGLAGSDGKHLAPRGREVLAQRLIAALDYAASH